MNQNLTGILVSFGFVFLVLGAATAASRKWQLEEETSRKIIHISLCNWIFIPFIFFTQALYACIVPACFIAINYASHKKNLIKAMERRDDSSLGTVWYAVSLLLLTRFSFYADMPHVAMCGMLAMGYGDGMAALVGRRWGRGMPGGKSVLGAVAMAVTSGVAAYLVCMAYLPRVALPTAVLCGMLGSLLELFSPRGLDNLTVPLGVGAAVWLVSYFDGALLGVFLCICITLWVLVVALSLGSITDGAFLAAYLLGVALYLLGGWAVYSALIVFFILGSGVSRLGKGRKESASRLHHRRGARTVWQVLANGAPPLLFLVVYIITKQESCLVAAIACFAGAAADTFSSEIGMIFGREPVSILTLRPIQPGLSGGVTAQGLCGASLGSLLLSLFAAPFGFVKAGIVFLCGIVCSLLDSVLGASVQVKYRMPDGTLTERPVLDGQSLPCAGGFPAVNNDVVNFCSILLSGLLAAILARYTNP